MRGPGRRSAKVGLTLAGIVLTVASCTSHPIAVAAPAATAPQLRHLASAIVLEAVHSQIRSPAGCPAGSATVSGPGADPGRCYRPLGKPLTITAAAISLQQNTTGYGIFVTVSAAERAALTAITTKTAHSRGDLAISVAGKTWEIPEVLDPITQGQFEILLQSRNQALQLERILAPSS